MTSKRDDLERRLSKRKLSVCDVSWCQEKTSGLSRYCATHKSRRRTTGDPKGSTLRNSHVSRHASKAKAYLLGNRGHRTIEAGLSWAFEWLHWGRLYGSSWRGLSPTHQARQYLAHLREQGIHEADVLATIVAVTYIREYEPGSLRSDEHFRFQTIVHVLRLTPWPSDGGNGTTRRRFYRPSPSAVDVLWRSIPVTILALARVIAAKIEEDEKGPSVDIDALRLPLPTHSKETS